MGLHRTRPWLVEGPIRLCVLCAAAFLIGLTSTSGDTIRTRSGIGYGGRILEIDAQGLVVIEMSGSIKRAIPPADIIRVEADQYPDLARAEAAFDRGVALAHQAERLYKKLMEEEPPTWLQTLARWRLFHLRVTTAKQLEALELYLQLAEDNPQFAASVTLPKPTERDPERQRAMMARVTQALGRASGKPYARELLKLREALVALQKTQPKALPTPNVSDKAREAFASLFGDQLAKVQTTRDPQDDVALAVELLQAAKVAGNQPDFLLLLCEKAWELGNRDPSGYATAIEAMRILEAKVPAAADACQRRILATLQNQFVSESDPRRTEAGKAIIETLLRMADQKSEAGDLEHAISLTAQALEVARSASSTHKADIEARLERLKHRQQILVKIAALKEESETNATNQKTQEEIFLLYVIELNDPAEASKHAASLNDESAKRCVLLATMSVDRLPEAACLQLGDWYRSLAERASTATKPDMLSRAHTYYTQYLEKHTTDDLSRTKVLVALNRIETAIKQSRARADGDAARFFGLPLGGADRIVFIVDRSGSMTDSIDYVKFELKRCISVLPPTKRFHVIFYSSGPPIEMSTRRPTDVQTAKAAYAKRLEAWERARRAGKLKGKNVRPPKPPPDPSLNQNRPMNLFTATEQNKKLAFEFIDTIIPQGETDPADALRRAFALRPDAICLLTDGEFDRAVIDLVKRANISGRARVHTIGFLYRTGEATLKLIAQQNNGIYKFVSEADLAKLAQ